MRLVLRADDVEHLHAGGGEVGGRTGDGGVDAGGTLRAAGHQQRGEVVAQAEGRQRLGAEGGPVEGGDEAPDRQARPHRVRQVRVGEAGRHVVGHPGTEPVGDAGHRVALVDHDRHAALAGGEVGRHRHVAAEADDDVGADAVDHLEGGGPRGAQPGRRTQQVGAGTPRKGHPRHVLERQPGLGHEARLEALTRAEAGDLGRGVEPSEGVGRGEQGRGVAGGTAAGEEYAHRS